MLTRLNHTGRGTLTIENGSNNDSVVALTGSSDRVAAAVYLQAEATYVVKNFPDGKFTIFFTTGVDWDGDRFTHGASYKRFSQQLTFTTTSSTYTTWTITLHPVVGGNAPTYPISPGDFPGLEP